VVPELSAPERDLLKAMLEAGPALIRFVFTHLTADAFQHPLARRAVDAILRHAGSEGSEGSWKPSVIIDALEDEDMRRLIAEISMSKFAISRNWTEVTEADPWVVAEAGILRLKVLDLDNRITENLRRLREAQQRGDDVMAFKEESIRLQKLKKEIQTARLIKET
jgi:hypothetical protein